jgi:hypothetical protein
MLRLPESTLVCLGQACLPLAGTWWISSQHNQGDECLEIYSDNKGQGLAFQTGQNNYQLMERFYILRASRLPNPTL